MLYIENVHKTFDNGLVALEAIDLAIKPGEVVSLVGTSGCGKSTLLRILAGLEFPTLGAALIDGEVIRGPHPKVGLIFQEARLFPWLTVTENIQFGLRGLPPLDRQWRSDAVLQKVHLSQFAQALPRQLSGGMAQRVAIARALVTQPHILLLDEPFSALDAFTRSQLQDHLLEIWAEDRPTLLLVTHDVEEAVTLADRVLVIRQGTIDLDVSINLPRPRDLSQTKLAVLKQRILQQILHPQGSPAREFP